MAKCLGLYIDNKIIKYAKVSKERDDIKVESFGMQFYEKLEDAITKVIDETDSQKIPISINTTGEIYNYFQVFSLLSKNDMHKAINTEFEIYCEENGFSSDMFETRYITTCDKNEQDKIKIIHISNDKMEMDSTLQQLNGYKVSGMTPLPMVIQNLLNQRDETAEKNILIINIEKNTSVTTIIDGEVQNVNIIQEGSSDFLEKLSEMENSYPKAYEICKNTTIYTSMAGKDLQTRQEISYIETIMPTLYSIVDQVKTIITEQKENIEKIYISGTGAMINNVDIYFQEYLEGIRCEILKPYFIKNTGDMTIKDYQEVNSAISLGLIGVGEGLTEVNFKSGKNSDGFSNIMKMELNSETLKNIGEAVTNNDLGEEYTKTETNLLRIAIALVFLIVVYSIFSNILNTQMNKKEEEALASQKDISKQIDLASMDNEKIKDKTNDYSNLVDEINEQNERIEDRNKTRNAIPDLLNQLMYVIPENVRMDKITEDNGHITIYAQSDKYEQLGYFKAKIKSEVILTDVTSSGGVKEN